MAKKIIVDGKEITSENIKNVDVNGGGMNILIKGIIKGAVISILGLVLLYKYTVLNPYGILVICVGFFIIIVFRTYQKSSSDYKNNKRIIDHLNTEKRCCPTCGTPLSILDFDYGACTKCATVHHKKSEIKKKNIEIFGK